MKARPFHLDKRNGKLMGVCAGIGNYLGIDPTVVRIAAVVATILGAAPWSFILYAIAAFVAKPKRVGGDDDALSARTSAHALRNDLRDIDRRMAEVDNYVASSGGRLSREIEQLRG